MTLNLSCTQNKEKIQTTKFEPTWESLRQYEVPEWFRNAKFGIWAHWGPQCQPEAGDWYGRFMYDEGNWKNNLHKEKYGPQSTFGFKDVIHEWEAEKWEAEKLVALYKRAGARYFFAMGNHHDNFDLWESKYQEWNSVDIGPKKDILAGWAKAAKNNGLPFGVSIHSSHAWTWYETSVRADKEGEYAGIPYDGVLTKKDGKGKWWEGLDPQKLYVQNHPLSKDSESAEAIFDQWNWNNGAALPTEEYYRNFYNRTLDMIDKYDPDLLYFDDTVLPFWPVSNIGLDIAAYYYNNNMNQHDGNLEAVLFGKILSEEQKECLVWDVERGAAEEIQEKPWQTCTCIGDWHYDRSFYNDSKYKSAKTVMQMLVDIVSKNGNLLLNIPVKGDGSIDDKELNIVKDITNWMDINSECIYDTRPWFVYGEGPKYESSHHAEMKQFHFSEGKGGTYIYKDIRFTQKGDVLYAIVMESPKNNEEIIIKSLATESPYNQWDFKKVQLLGGFIKNFEFSQDGLKVKLRDHQDLRAPLVIKIY